ncbi:MAG: beta-1-3, beta-1-6-glucan biosynthesis protein [Pseudolabrys sp.]
MPKVYVLRMLRAAFCVAALSFVATAAVAQSGNLKPPDQQKPSGDAAKEGQKSIDEIAEAARVLTGPAGNPECVWLGRRVVSLLWRDDLDTAFRHLDLYDRFGCPSSHIQATFRCVVRQGNIDPKSQDSLNGRVQSCWLNPALSPVPPAATKAPAGTKPPAATSGGTVPR